MDSDFYGRQRSIHYDQQRVASPPPPSISDSSVHGQKQSTGGPDAQAGQARRDGRELSIDAFVGHHSSRLSQEGDYSHGLGPSTHKIQNDAEPEFTELATVHNNRERNRELNDSEHELTELAAPPPVDEDDSGEWRKEEYLEEAREGHEQSALPQSTSSRALTQLYILSSLAFFAILGDLARLGVQWLTFYSGAPVVISNLWANFGGTLLMGFLSEDRKIFQEEWGKKIRGRNAERRRILMASDQRGTSEDRAAHGKAKKTIPLFIGLTTGFCGTFTSFSTFMRDVFYALENGIPTPIDHPSTPISTKAGSARPRNGGYSVEAILAVVILTVCVCNGALYLGAHIAIALDRITPTLPYRFIRRALDPAVLILGFGCWLGAAFMAIWPPDRSGGPIGHSEGWRGKAVFSLVFAPLGCWGRYFLALKLNSRIPRFPMGTFIANMAGVGLLSMCFDLQHTPLPVTSASTGSTTARKMMVGGGTVGCQVLQGVQDGFCGALTTVSTWIVELNTLRRRHAWVYGSSSVVTGFCLTVILLGSVRWSVGYQQALCYPGNM